MELPGACEHIKEIERLKHARSSTHRVVISAETGERWLFCFPDEAFVEY